MTWIDMLGYAASAAVLATFCMGSMVPLRIVALVSNVLFILYGYFDQLYPVLTLHAALLPMNMLRLMQLQRSIRRGRNGIVADWRPVVDNAQHSLRHEGGNRSEKYFSTASKDGNRNAPEQDRKVRFVHSI